MNLIKWTLLVVLSILSLAYIYKFDEAARTLIGCFAAMAYALYGMNKGLEKNHREAMQAIAALQAQLSSLQSASAVEK